MTARTTSHRLVLALVTLGMLACMGAGPLERAKEKVEAEKVLPVVVRLYNVQDLMMGHDCPYRDAMTLATEVGERPIRAAAGGGGFGDLFGGGTSKLGDEAAMTSALTPQALEEILLRTIHGEPWADEGGRAQIERVGALFVITQTEAAHQQIQQLLEQFRRARRMVSIEARWLLLSSDALARLTGNRAKPRAVPQPVDLAAFQAPDMPWAQIYHGRINCFDRQTVYLASGSVEVYTVDSEPVVAENAVGWDPTNDAVLFGIFLEATPSITAERNEATVNLRTVVSEKGNAQRTTTVEAATSEGGVAKAEIDKPTFVVHTFRTTARLPLDTPVLLGGITSPQALDGKILCLILEVSASQDQAPAKAPAKAGK